MTSKGVAPQGVQEVTLIRGQLILGQRRATQRMAQQIDRARASSQHAVDDPSPCRQQALRPVAELGRRIDRAPVSYTQLTLPTILRV